MDAKGEGRLLMTLTEFYNAVAGKADTEGLMINAVETKRVLAVFFDLLEDLSPNEALDLLSKGLKQAAKRKR